MDQLEKLFAKLFDENEFLSPYGLRAVSAFHRQHPYELDVEGVRATIDYEPAESTTSMFGGNSNWRGPIWFPLNYLLISALERYARFFGDDFRVEFPTGQRLRRSAWARSSTNLRATARVPCSSAVPTDGVPASAGWTGCSGMPRGRTTLSSASTSTATTGPGLARPTRRAGRAWSQT